MYVADTELEVELEVIDRMKEVVDGALVRPAGADVIDDRGESVATLIVGTVAAGVVVVRKGTCVVEELPRRDGVTILEVLNVGVLIDCGTTEDEAKVKGVVMIVLPNEVKTGMEVVVTPPPGPVVMDVLKITDDVLTMVEADGMLELLMMLTDVVGVWTEELVPFAPVGDVWTEAPTPLVGG